MKIAIAGASGLIGMALVSKLKGEYHQILRLVRPPIEKTAEHISWNPSEGLLDPKDLEGVEGVINLAGENIAALRWTERKKKAIKDSRVASTRLLAETMAQMPNPPKFLLNASAIGYYGSRGSECLSEQSARGKGFLPDVCQQWEEATQPASKAGIRVVNLRFGMVLSTAGGALSRMLLPFKLCLGGVLGSGEQWISWISIDDAINAIKFLMDHEDIAGPVNLVSPDSVTNRELTEAIGKVLHRPTLIPMPKFVVKTLFGEMGDALMLSSTVVKPKILLNSGFEFEYPELQPALEHLIAK